MPGIREIVVFCFRCYFWWWISGEISAGVSEVASRKRWLWPKLQLCVKRGLFQLFTAPSSHSLLQNGKDLYLCFGTILHSPNRDICLCQGKTRQNKTLCTGMPLSVDQKNRLWLGHTETPVYSVYVCKIVLVTVGEATSHIDFHLQVFFLFKVHRWTCGMLSDPTRILLYEGLALG